MMNRFIIYHPLSEDSNILFVSKRINEYVVNDRFQPESIEECIYIFQLYKYANDIIRLKIKNDSIDYHVIRNKFSVGIKSYLKDLSEESILHWLKDKNSFYGAHNFLSIIEKFKLYNLMNEHVTSHILMYSKSNLAKVLELTWFVRQYRDTIRDFVIDRKKYNIILKSLYGENHEPNYIKSLEIDQKKVNEILLEYINSKKVHLSYLKLISDANSRGVLIEPRTRFEAQQTYQQLVDKYFKETNGPLIDFGVKSQMTTGIENLFEIEKEGFYYKIYYNLEKNDELKDLDVLLNYLYYTKAYYTDSGTWNASHKTISRLAKVFETRAPKYLNLTEDQKLSLMLNKSFIKITDDLMKLNSGRYLDLIKYFIEDILPSEYGLDNIKFEIPDTKNQKEINTMLVINLEHLIKTYNYFVEYGKIEYDVMRYGYNTPKIDNLKSQTTMYISINEDKKIYNLAFLLFDNQSPLSYHEKYSENVNGNNFYSIISTNEHMSIKNWAETDELNLLIRNNILYLENNEILKLNDKPTLSLWYLLYVMKSVNTYYFDSSFHKSFELLIQKGYAIKVNSLLTKEESLIFSYLYNNEKFSNGPAIRNKYAHSDGPPEYSNEELFSHYYTILLLYTIIILKINDDCRITLNKHNANTLG